jgi:hypothetical protein
VKAKRNVWLPMLLMLAFALTRWPGLLPPNLSAAYALAFCAGVYFPRKMAWWLPLATMGITDLLLNLFYYDDADPLGGMQWANYAVYAMIIWLGTGFKPRDSWLKLLSGGLLGAILFYLITNTAAWFFNPFGNPEYTKDLMGWITALTTGTKAGWLQTWELFRNTLLGGGLFTGLFAGAMKLSESVESALEKEPATEKTEEPSGDEAPQPEEAKT